MTRFTLGVNHDEEACYGAESRGASPSERGVRMRHDSLEASVRQCSMSTRDESNVQQRVPAGIAHGDALSAHEPSTSARAQTP